MQFDKFSKIIEKDFSTTIEKQKALAVGVSGGPDSMALLWLLQEWCSLQGKDLHVLSVDHGLREDAQKECALVAEYCSGFDHVCHETLVWEAPQDVRIQEEARKARYDLMRGYCKAHGISSLFLGHHQDDQAETVLFRLAKGSGLDGLSGMAAVQEFQGFYLCRPLLEVSKQELVQLCNDKNIPYSHDPSNDNEAFARVRLRQSIDILAKEGLTSKRLSVTANRLARARQALDIFTDEAFERYLISKNAGPIEFSKDLLDAPEEIVIRVLFRCFDLIGLDRDYAPRMEKVESLVDALKNDASFRRRTLGGIIFERDDKAGYLILMRENNEP